MESYEYKTLYEFETSYWWFLGLHEILLNMLRSMRLGQNSMVLDAGCGTGQNIANVRREITMKTMGFDVSFHAAPFWKKRSLSNISMASINEIPIVKDTFDAVMSIDILCEEAVDADRAYRELWRVTKPGGYLLLTVPAYDWLMSEEHHRAVHANKRYSRKQVVTLMNQLPVEIVRVTHLFSLLLPIIAVYRLISDVLPRKKMTSPRSDLQRLPFLLNKLLLFIIRVEGYLLKIMNLPFGSSILAIARKESE